MNVHSTDPITSALADIDNQFAREAQIKEVCTALFIYPSSTSKELAGYSNINRELIAKRLPDAEKRGLVERTGKRKCKAGGRLSVTWKIIEGK
jgi:predicted HTH transcriptional regulator